MADKTCDPLHLVALVKSGDERALEHITRCYGARLLAAGRRHCRTQDEAEDAVQDALLTAATELPAFRAEGSLEGFLVRIVARACRRISRGQKNNNARHDVDVALVDLSASPEKRAEALELGQMLELALLELGPLDRAVLLLSDVDDYSGPEVAAQLGLSAGAVRARLTRARSRLREQLQPWLDAETKEFEPSV